MSGVVLEAIHRVLDDQKFILGPEVSSFESRVADYCGVEFAIGVSSGSDALLVSLMALGIERGDEIITSPYSFFAAAGAIVRLGAVPVFVDIDPLTYNLDPTGVAAAMCRKTKGILPVHLFGQCADMDPILEVAAKHEMPVVEDAAQAMGADYHGQRRSGSLGTLGCLSFFPTKNLGGMGDGGMVLTSNAALAEAIRVLRVHGGDPKYYHRVVGGNFRLDALQAAVLAAKLDYLDGWIAGRQLNARRYMDLFASAELPDELEISLPQPVYDQTDAAHYHTYNQFVVRVPDRDNLIGHLTRNGIATAVYYPVPLHLQESMEYLGHKKGDFPEAERAAEDTLALPMYPELNEEGQERVVSEIGRFYR